MSKEIATRAQPTAVVARPFDFSELERMAASVAKSNMFAVKTPEAALTLFLMAQAENIHPATALNDYHLIGGKPSLKSDAMLSRFQRSGGRVQWLQNTDACVEATFTHPYCVGPVTVKWDDERCKKAGLLSENHRKFPQQMKRARCITEGVRATAPGCMPAGIYSPEEMSDSILPEEVVITTVKEAVQTVASGHNALTAEERAEHIEAITASADIGALASAFGKAWKHAGDAKDQAAATEFKTTYDMRKIALAKPATQESGDVSAA